MKRIGFYLALLCLAGAALAMVRDPQSTAQSSTSQQGTTYYVSLIVYQLQHKPTISAAFIHLVLVTAHSSAANDSQALYDLGMQSGIDPVYALAFFHHESDYGTTGEARVTHSLGNERCIADRPCIDRDRGGYALMRSWVDGFQHWYDLILNLYIRQWHLVTLDQIIPRYAPVDDGNNVQGYIGAVEQDVVTWRAESQASV